MKLTNEKRDVNLSSGMRTQAFTIKASAKAFERLAADYSDNILAVIRELSTNAADSMADAGKKDQPFIVHLPNNFEPWFSVKDNGTGMDEETVFNLYTTFFDSDKTDTDDQTGCLGLGSKSPFAYTDNFTVISRFNGSQTNYSCFTHEDGCPHITAHDPVPTEECNGVEILLAVKLEDFDAFKLKAEEALQWFSVPYEVVGNNEFKIPKVDYLHKTDSYGILKSSQGYATVIMGNVAYQLGRHGHYRCANNAEEKLLSHGVHLFAPMGAVDFQNNREQMRFTNKTNSFISSALQEVIKYVREEAIQEVNKAKTRWEAMSVYTGNAHPIMGSIREYGWTAQWNNEIINGSIAWRKLEEAPLLETMQQGYGDRPAGYQKEKVNEIFAPSPGEPFHLFVCDMNTGNYRRIVDHMEENHPSYWNRNRKVYVISQSFRHIVAKEFTGHKQPFSDGENRLDVIETLKEYGIPYTLTSSLVAKKERVGRSYAPRTELAKLNKFDNTYAHSKAWDHWEAADVDVSQGGLYIEIAHYNIFFPPKSSKNSEKLHPKDLIQYTQCIKDFLGDQECPKIYGIRPCDMKFLKKHQDKWMNVYDFLKKVFEENKDEWEPILIMDSSIRENSCFLYHAFKAQGFTYDHPDVSKFAKDAQLVGKYEGSRKLRAFNRLCFQFNSGWYDKVKDYSPLIENIKKKFPLLNHVDTWSKRENEELSQSVREYVIKVGGGNEPASEES